MVKIIIIGAGISGLSTYLFLHKHLLLNSVSAEQYDIKIYEAYDIHQSKFNTSASDPADRDPAKALSSHETDPIFTPEAIGAAIGISQNGLSVLSRLDADGRLQENGNDSLSIIQQMALHGHPVERWAISTARGFKIVDVNLAPSNKAKGAAKSPTASEQPGENLYHGIMIARQACWEILRDRVLAVAPGVVTRKKVIDVVIGDESTRNLVKFEDGSHEEADLVIGADGLRSVLRRAMFQQEQKATEKTQGAQSGRKGWFPHLLSYLPFTHKEVEPKEKDFVSPHYEGLVGVGGFVPSSVLESTGHKPGTMSIVFGRNGFFGYGYLTSTPQQQQQQESCSVSSPGKDSTASNTSNPLAITAAPGPLAGWWSTFSSPNQPYPYSTTSPTTPTGFNKSLALQSLQTRHSTWINPSIAAILSFVQSDTETHGANGKGLDASYPTWTTPELPHWSKNGRVVLVGDAAHALQPSSGQGACQALEDAEALALILNHHLAAAAGSSSPPLSKSSSNEHTSLLTPSSPPASLHKSLTTYHAFRSPRVHRIHLRSQKMSSLKSDMNTLTEYTVYFFIWMTTWRWLNWTLKCLGLSDLERYNEELFGYDLPGEVERFLRAEGERETRERL